MLLSSARIWRHEPSTVRPLTWSGSFLDAGETRVYNQSVVQRVAPPAVWRRTPRSGGGVEAPETARRGPTRTPDRGVPRRGRVGRSRCRGADSAGAGLMPGEVMT